MRYADFYECDICNGNEVGVSLFVQGCPIHCDGCFNKETWDFDGGKEWTPQVEKRFMELVGRDYIHRVTILGGEPLCLENHADVFKLIVKIRQLYPDKKIWVFTGNTYENIQADDDFHNGRNKILQYIDVLVDGPFKKDKKDLTLKFCGSSNQRLIDMPQTLLKSEVVLWDNEV